MNDPQNMTDAELLAALGLDSSPRVSEVAKEPPSFREQVEEQAGPLQRAASGFLGGLTGFGDLASLAVDYSPFSSKGVQRILATGAEAVAPDLGITPAPRGETLGDKMRSGIDYLTGIEDSTKIGEDSLAYKVGNYAPSFLLSGGAGSVAQQGAKGAAQELAGRLALTGAAAVGGKVGEEEGGAVGELIGSAALPLTLPVAGAALKRAGGVAEELAQGTKNRLYGVGAGDIKRSLERDVRAQGDEALISKALDSLIESKAIEPRAASENLAALELQRKAIGEELGQKLRAFEQVQPEPITVRFSTARAAAKKLKSTDRKAAMEMIDELETLSNQNNALIGDWQNEQAELAKSGAKTLGKVGSEELRATIEKFAAIDVRNAIEAELKKPIYRDVIGEDAVDAVKALRKELSNRHAVEGALASAAAREGVVSLSDAITNMTKTTGGYGVPILAGMAAGGPVGALAGAGAGYALRSKAGQQAAYKGLESAAPRLRSGGERLQSMLDVERLLRSLALAQGSQAAGADEDLPPIAEPGGFRK